MERLTAWSDYGAYFPKCYEEPCDGNGTENDCDNCGFMDDVCRKLARYEDIGTLEEVREAVEKQKEERPIAVLGTFGGEEHECRECGNTVEYMDEYCKWCGKKLDWSEEDEQ